MCQRDKSTFYDFLIQEDEKEDIEDQIHNFFYHSNYSHSTHSNVNENSNSKSNSNVSFSKINDSDIIISNNNSSSSPLVASDSSISCSSTWTTQELGIDSYTLDIYIDKKKRVWLVDFNLFGPPTDSLLFSWGELLQLAC